MYNRINIRSSIKKQELRESGRKPVTTVSYQSLYMVYSKITYVEMSVLLQIILTFIYRRFLMTLTLVFRCIR